MNRILSTTTTISRALLSALLLLGLLSACSSGASPPPAPPSLFTNADNEVLLTSTSSFDNLNMFAGDDHLTIVTGSVIAGMLEGGAGTDTLRLEGGSIGSGTGANHVNFNDVLGFEHITLVPASDVTFDTDFQTLSNALLADLEEDNNVIFGEGGSASGTLNIGQEEDEATRALENHTLNLGAGANSFTMNLAKATVYGQVQFGAGNDAFAVVAGDFTGSVRGDAGNDLFTVSGGTIDAPISGGAGDDRFTISGGTLSSALSGQIINGGAGNDTVTISGGRFTGAIAGGPDIDTFVGTGDTIGETTGFLDISLLREFENLTLRADAGATWTATATDLLGMLDTTVANNLQFRSRATGLLSVGGQGELNLAEGADIVTIDAPNANFTSTIRLGAGDDEFTILDGTISGAGVNGDAGNDTFVIGAAARFVNATFAIDGGADDDTLIINGNVVLTDVFPSALGDELMPDTGNDGLRSDSLGQIRGIENFTIMPASSVTALGSHLSLDSLRLQSGVNATRIDLGADGRLGRTDGQTQLVFEIGGHAAGRLELTGNTADLNVVVERGYSPSRTDLSVHDALSVSGRMGDITTDDASGLSCHSADNGAVAGGSTCDLQLYDRAVPAALALSSLLTRLPQATDTDALQTLRMPQHNALTTKPIAGQLSDAGRVDWSLQSQVQTQASLSGVQLQWQGRGQRRFRHFGLRQTLRATHLQLAMDSSADSSASPTGYSLSGRLTGVDGGLDLLWGTDKSLLAITAKVGEYRSDALSLYDRPIGGDVRASRRAVSLSARHQLLTSSILSLRGQVSRSQDRLLLQGLDQLQVAVGAGGTGYQVNARLGLGGDWSSQRSQLTWAADYVYRPDTLSAQVLNTDAANTTDWTGATESLQWSLGWQRNLGSNSRIHFSAAGRADLRQTDLNAKSSRTDSRDYRLQLGFSHRL